MSAKYFIPYCIKPIFLHPTQKEARTCGLVNGLIYSALITLIVAAAGGRFYFVQENPETKKRILYGILIGLAIVWIFMPLLSWYGNGNMWKGYESTIVDLMNQGYTRQQAIAFLQGMVDESPQLGLAQGLSAMVFAKAKPSEENKEENKEEKK